MDCTSREQVKIHASMSKGPSAQRTQRATANTTEQKGP